MSSTKRKVNLDTYQPARCTSRKKPAQQCYVFPAQGSPVSPGTAFGDIWAPIYLAGAKASPHLSCQCRDLVCRSHHWLNCMCVSKHVL